jgi:hypothetical protein
MADWLMNSVAVAPMFGPRDSILRIFRGEDVPIEEMVRDLSPFVDARTLYFCDYPELWIEKVHDHVGGIE